MKTSMDLSKRLRISLLALRVGVFITLFMWTIDKFVNPDHAALVFANFYAIDGLTATFSYLVGAVQLIIICAFLAGYMKPYTYGAIFLMQLVPTLASFGNYLQPWAGSNLLFFAAWPMLAATFALFLLKSEDTMLSVSNTSAVRDETDLANQAT